MTIAGRHLRFRQSAYLCVAAGEACEILRDSTRASETNCPRGCSPDDVVQGSSVPSRCAG
nr:hypothetical protein [Mycobacterium pseudoshottsii]